MIRGRRGAHAGYLRLDNRGARADRSARVLTEMDTVHCPHCEALVEVVGTEYRSGGRCTYCDGYRCLSPACQPCVPFMKRLEAQERRDRFARAAGLVEG